MEPSVVKHQTETSPPLNRLEVLRGLRISIWEGAAATVWITLTGGAFLTGFALWLHANSFAIGLLSALPTLAALTQPVAAYVMENKPARKPFVAWCSFAGRILWLPILLLPFFLPPRWALLGFLLLFALSSVLTSMPQPVWTAWMSDLVPPDHRGRYFGHRNMVAGLVGMVVGMVAAWYLDNTIHRHHSPAVGFACVFGAGLVGAVFSLILILRQPEPTTLPSRYQNDEGNAEKEAKQSFWDYYRAPFADPNFRALLAFSAVFCIGQFIAAPFFTAYGLQVLRLNYVWMQVFAAVVGITNLLAMPLWGFLSDRFGNKPILVLNVLGVFILPFFWIPTSPQHLTFSIGILILNNIGGGLFWAGVGLTQFNLIIASSPPQRTAAYAATLSAITGLIGGIAPLVGGMLLQSLRGVHLSFFGLPIINYHILFALAGIMRLAALPFLRKLEDKGAVSPKTVLQDLGRSGLRQWRYIRALQRANEEEARLRAAEGLTGKTSRLALSELGLALFDPSRAVRAEAARALGETEDAGAVDMLLHALQDTGTDIVEEITLALQKLKDRRANNALIALLESGSRRLSKRERLAIIRALGVLGGADSVEALLREFLSSEDEEVLEAVAQALGRTGARRAVRPLKERLQRLPLGHPLQREIIWALGEIGDRSVIPAMRNLLAHISQEPSILPPLADALARLEDVAAVPQIVRGMGYLSSPVARRQVAHAVGRLLKIGDCVYSLLAAPDAGREEAMLRLWSELQKNMDSSLLDSQAIEQALLAGNFREALSQLQKVFTSLQHQFPRSSANTALNAFLGNIQTLPPIPEAVPLALCALRAFLSGAKENEL